MNVPSNEFLIGVASGRGTIQEPALGGVVPVLLGVGVIEHVTSERRIGRR